MGLRDLHINALSFELHVKPSVLECVGTVFARKQTLCVCPKGV